MAHKHFYQPLDVEKSKDTSARYTNEYHRTTRLFCTECGETKETKESVSFGHDQTNRPDWTYNI